MRPLANCIAVAERSTGSLGEAVSSLLVYAKGLILGDWSEPLFVAAITAFVEYFGPNKLGLDEFGLMLAAYVLDRRNKCDYISEEGLDLVFETLTTIALNSGGSFSHGQVLQREFASFCTLKGEFSKDQPADQSAIDWWKNISSCRSLRYIATVVVAYLVTPFFGF